MAELSPIRSGVFALRTLVLASGLALGSIALAAPQPALLQAAENMQTPVIKQLKEMVLIESGSDDVEGLLQMADLMEKRLQELGFDTQRVKTLVGAGADSVLATIKGTGERKIMLLGHMDTVYPRGILESQPYKVEEGRIYGPGIADDKGGLALILGSLHILKNLGWNDFDTLTVLVNPDEEVGSQGSRDLIAATADEHDVVLSFEPTAAKQAYKNHIVLLGAAGIAEVKLEVKGRAAHAGNAPQDGRNALYELAHRMLQTKDLPEQAPGTSLNWTVAQTGGNPFNQIPESASAVADMRIMKPGAEVVLQEALEKTIAEGPALIPDTETTVTVELNRPAFDAGPKGLAVAQKAQAIYDELGLELTLLPMVGGGTDAAHAARSGKAAVVEAMGLAGFGYHARDEYIDTDSIVPRLYLITRLLAELARD